MPLDLSDESHYDRTRLRQWARGRARSAGVDRPAPRVKVAVGARARWRGVDGGGAAGARPTT
ncbi:sulfite oxidase, partial [Streptomyces yangpuensis]